MYKFLAAEIVSLFAVCSIGLVCCNTTNTPPPEPPITVVGADASDASIANVTNACQKIVSLCNVTSATCTAGMNLMISDPVQPFVDWTCISGAGSKAVLQGCTGISVAGCP